MKKIILLFSFFLSIVTFTYAGGYCNFGSPKTNPSSSGGLIYGSATYNIGETQNYYMCVSAFPHSGYNTVGWSVIDPYDKNSNIVGQAAAHYTVYSTGETQVSLGYVYVDHFTWNYGLWPGQTATAIVWW